MKDRRTAAPANALSSALALPPLPSAGRRLPPACSLRSWPAWPSGLEAPAP